jgi:hypothetical protein
MVVIAARVVILVDVSSGVLTFKNINSYNGSESELVPEILVEPTKLCC